MNHVLPSVQNYFHNFSLVGCAVAFSPCVTSMKYSADFKKIYSEQRKHLVSNWNKTFNARKTVETIGVTDQKIHL